MRGISFEYTAPAPQQNPNRLDVACFFGLARPRGGELPGPVADWLDHTRWRERYTASGSLLDIPVPIHGWDEFAALFQTTRLDSHAEVSSVALPPTLDIPTGGTELYAVTDGEREQVSIAEGSTDLAALVETINAAFTLAEARIDERDGENFLVLRRLDTERPGAISVFSNPLLGYPVAAKDQNYNLLTYLAAAVRAFFREGGQQCYVIAMGEPDVLDATSAERLRSLSQLLWADPDRLGAADAAQFAMAYLHDWAAPSTTQADWHGPAHLLGLEDVTNVCFPDLPDLIGTLAQPAEPPPTLPAGTTFVECTPTADRPRERMAKAPEPAECNLTAYQGWTRLIFALRHYLSRVRSDLQLLAALPWPDQDLRRNLPETVRNEVLSGLNDERVQLAFPWLKTRESGGLPGGAEPPDAALAGLLARGVLFQGAYRSVAGIPLPSIYDVAPRLPQSMDALEDTSKRICWFGDHPRGWQLYSDVTTRSDGANRHGAVRWLFILLVRAARNEGWARVFEPNGPNTWRMIERNMSRLLARIYGDNGLRGRKPSDAFSVQCDRSVMTNHDIDNGRVITVIQVAPALPLNNIVVALSLDELGRVNANEVVSQ